MHETAMLHFDLSQLSPDQPFTLHAGSGRYDLTPHTRQTLARSRRDNAALALVPDERVTHFAGPVRLPGDAVVLLRVTAPKRNPDDLLDRLVLTAVHLPRKHRTAALAQQRQRLQGRPLPLPPKLQALGVTDTPTPAEEYVLDLHDMKTALDAAESLIFHHAELLTTSPDWASRIFTEVIQYAAGLNDLQTVIYNQSQAHDKDPKQDNWANSEPGQDWKTGDPLPGQPIYCWSKCTLDFLGPPLQDALLQSKNTPELMAQCWTVQPGRTWVPLTEKPAQGQLAGEPEAVYTVKEVTPQSGVEHSFEYEPAAKTATVGLKNYYLRWLQVCVDQYAPGPNGPGKQVGTTQILGQQSPVDTIMAVPLEPEESQYSFTFDDEASSATVSFGGLGQAPFDWAYDGGGIIWTSVFNYAVPTLFTVAGIAADQFGAEWSTVTKNLVSKGLAITEAAASGPVGNAVSGSNVDSRSVMLAVTNCAGSLLLGLLTEAGAEALKEFIAEKLGEAALQKAAPFIGWISYAVGAAADLASMVETSVEVASSPATMSISIERTMDVQVSVVGDKNHQNQLPSTATYYTITITYDNGPVRTFSGAMGKTTQNEVSHTFAGLPAGGQITVLASFYSETGWLAGQGSSGSVKAQPNSENDPNTLVVSFEIKENEVPLSAATTYTFKEKLAFASGARVWRAPPAVAAPTDTVSSLDASNVDNRIGQLGQLTLNEAKSALGYSWQAAGQNVPLEGTGSQPYTGQEYTLQAVNDAADPQGGLKFSGVGWIARPCLAFPPPTMPNPPADGFVLDPIGSDASSDLLLRAVSLEPGQPLMAAPGQSFGRFTGAQDDLAIHPAGYAVALYQASCKLQILRLGTQVADAAAPAAIIRAGQGTRPGLLEAPVAVSCALDKIMVLQTTDTFAEGCVCAFDVKGNPVNCFAGNTSWIAGLHPEADSVVLVDLSVEATGYLYVLKYLQSGAPTVAASDYRLDIYNPGGSFLAQVPGLAAAQLHVDLWRNLFTLNYEILPGSGRTEPSVSQWIPSTPGTDGGSTGGN